MAIKEIPQKYETSDGREFDTAEEAKRHDELMMAKSSFESARYKLGQALARTQKTADGHLFDFLTWHEYLYVTPGYWGWPELARVNFSGYNFGFDDSDGFIIRQRAGDSTVEYLISDLYYDPANAAVALLAAQEKRLAEFAKDVEEQRQKVEGIRSKESV